MSYYKEVKGSSVEQLISGQSQGELSGAGMYFSLAHAAKEHHMDEVADHFTTLAMEHVAQSTFYALISGRYPYDEEEFWQFIKGLSKAEEYGDVAIKGLADKVEEGGFSDAADTIRTFAAQHTHHAEVTHKLLEKYAPDIAKAEPEKRYVCSVCGYVYEGELADEPEDFTCPLCGMPKDSFREEM